MEKTLRKSYYCSEKTGELINKYSTELGISESSFINLCVDAYNTQRIAINTMQNFDGIMARLEALESRQADK